MGIFGEAAIPRNSKGFHHLQKQNESQVSDPWPTMLKPIGCPVDSFADSGDWFNSSSNRTQNAGCEALILAC